MQKLHPGTKVLVENTKKLQRKGGKLEARFLGPYTVYSSTGKGLCVLATNQGVLLQRKYNMKRLKVYKYFNIVIKTIIIIYIYI